MTTSLPPKGGIMGLFDKRDRGKRKSGGSDDFDSPVEKIDLSAAPAPEPKPRSTAPAKPAPEPVVEKAPAPAPAPVVAKPKPIVKQPEPPQPEDDYEPPAYGINKAIELMRSLPADNVELVVQVVKHTLESTRIQISTIIEDASRKQGDIQGRIKVLQAEIAEYEQEIATRKEEIGKLEADYEETTTVKDRLVLAENLGKKDSAGAEAKSPLPGVKPAAPRPAATASPAASPLGKKPTIVAKK